MKKIYRLIGVILFFMSNFYTFGQPHPFNISDSGYEKILEKSLLSKGNNYRLKKVLEKLEKGEKVTIAAIGGSVTEGAGPEKFTDGYAYQFFRRIQSELTPDGGRNVFFDNAALSGTPSPLGLLRYKTDVLDVLGTTPDLLFIEFSVNDYQECTSTRGYEALIHDALVQNPETAVIAFYAAATYGNSQALIKPIADYYGIQQVSISDAIAVPLANGLIKKEEYYTDSVHPFLAGHEIMADALMNLLYVTKKASIDSIKTVPLKSYNKGGNFFNLKRILGDDSNVKITKGGFTGVDPDCQTNKKTNKSNFPINWYHKTGAANEPFKVELNCKNFLFVSKVQGSWMKEKFGKADIYVDGKKKLTIDGAKEGGWNNSEIILLIDETEAKKHVIEVRMAEGSENLGFTVVAMAYTE